MLEILNIQDYILSFENFPDEKPWELVGHLQEIIKEKIKILNEDFIIKDDIAIHKTAIIEQNVIIKSPAIIGSKTFIGANAYLRNGVIIGEECSIGVGCEIKNSVIFNNSSVAHFNFIGDSIIGSFVNFEAGSITANHYNERKDKTIFCNVKGEIINTKIEKFGALVGDYSKIGANAVLSPGTILEKNSIIKRLESVEQI